jgi:hypothetical protein
MPIKHNMQKQETVKSFIGNSSTFWKSLLRTGYGIRPRYQNSLIFFLHIPLIEIGRCYGMEINVEKTEVMRISRQQTPVTIKIDQTQLENVKCFKYLGSLLTDDGRCTL